MDKVYPEHFLKRLPAAERAKLGRGGLTKEECERIYESGEELELQSHMRDFFVHVSPPVYVHQAPMRKKPQGKPGRADFVLCYRGKWISMEAKAKTGKQSPEQIQHQKEIKAAGGIYEIVRSLQDVQTVLRAVDKEHGDGSVR